MVSFLAHAELGFESFLLPGGEDGIVLLHGFTASPVEVRQLADFLHSQGYTVSGPLLPGHGTHPDDLNRVKFEDWVHVSEEAVEALKATCKHVFIGGESMGGLVAMRVAELHPELAGVLLYAPGLQANNIWAAPLLKHFIKYLKKDGAGNGFIWSGYNVYPIGGADEMRKLQKVVDKNLEKISQPVLLMMSKADTMVPQTVIETIQHSVSSDIIDLHVFEDSDHCILLDKYNQEAFEITLAFIRKITNS
ncbi:MAG TPA: alpha/beta fold hydrolase [Anaerolineaceae bacterium]|nr:alpha/beta fold hydrolase [Anaerolineaceae bacterium]